MSDWLCWDELFSVSLVLTGNSILNLRNIPNKSVVKMDTFQWIFSVLMNQHFWQKAVLTKNSCPALPIKQFAWTVIVCVHCGITYFIYSVFTQTKLPVKWQAQILKSYIASPTKVHAPSEAVLPGALPFAPVPRFLKGIHSMEACLLIQLWVILTCDMFHCELSKRQWRSPAQGMMRFACQILRSDYITVQGHRGKNGVCWQADWLLATQNLVIANI